MSIIDQTEAIRTIDIDTGLRHRNLERFNLRIQHRSHPGDSPPLRRNLGIVVIDFIDMNNEITVDGIALLEQALSKDRVKTSINGFSQLGLVEMNRKRTR